jgi:hypothetical protein
MLVRRSIEGVYAQCSAAYRGAGKKSLGCGDSAANEGFEWGVARRKEVDTTKILTHTYTS